MHRVINRRNAILGNYQHFDGTAFIELDHFTEQRVQLLQGAGRLRTVRTEPLEIIVQMRQVHETQIRPVVFLDPHGRAANPPGRLNPSHGPPELGKGKISQVRFDRLAQVGGMRVNVEYFPPIRAVNRPRSNGKLGRGIHVVPPKNFGGREIRVVAADFFPQFFTGHEVITLLPELDFSQ